MNEVAIHARVSGLVQGVFFRAKTKEQAESLGLCGWVKNMPGGEVELEACGDEQAIQALTEWLWQGPPMAKVQQVEVKPCPVQAFSGFSIR